MMTLLGMLLLLGPALYAVAWVWLRGGFLEAETSKQQSELLADMPAAKPGTALQFSVLIAARDEAAALPHLLQALASQRLAPHLFEVLVVDDHSTDGTAALLAAAQ
jgi:hypothetical protein